MKFPSFANLFPEGLFPAFEKVRNGHSRSMLHDNLDSFFDKIDFKTEAETLLPENIEQSKAALFTLCKDMNWISVEQSLEELLAEKSGVYAMRGKDSSVPNWYHEFRQILPTLSALRDNIYTEDHLRKHGGIEALLTAKFRHDSYEDYGKTPTHIYAGIEGRLHEQNASGHITDTQLFMARKQAAIAVDVVDLVSKKTKFTYLDDDGVVKEFKNDFYNGDNNAYYRATLEHFFAYELKTVDGIEGLSTRIVPAEFSRTDSKLSVESNLTYAREKRSLYGRASMDKMAMEKWPEFKSAIRSIDSMLRLNLVTLEVVNDHYVATSKLNAENAFPMRVNRYLENAFDAYKHVPKGFNPLLIQIERLETIAKDEISRGQYKMANILEKAVYPSLIPVLGNRAGTLVTRRNPESSHYEGDNPAPMQ